MRLTCVVQKSDFMFSKKTKKSVLFNNLWIFFLLFLHTILYIQVIICLSYCLNANSIRISTVVRKNCVCDISVTVIYVNSNVVFLKKKTFKNNLFFCLFCFFLFCFIYLLLFEKVTFWREIPLSTPMFIAFEQLYNVIPFFFLY